MRCFEHCFPSTCHIGNLTLDKVFIWQVAPAANFFASAADHQEVASALSLPANTEKPIATNFTLDRTKDLLIAFDISAAPGQGNVPSVLLAGAPHYFKAATRLESVPNGLGFSQGPVDRLYLVEKIEVS